MGTKCFRSYRLVSSSVLPQDPAPDPPKRSGCLPARAYRGQPLARRRRADRHGPLEWRVVAQACLPQHAVRSHMIYNSYIRALTHLNNGYG